jgi:IS4 transposase
VPLSKRSKSAGAKQSKIHPRREERLAKPAFGRCRADIKRPSTATQATTEQLALNVVYVWETEPPPGESPIEWVLYTSEPIDTTEQLLRVVDWYRSRWVIEEYFKALKTGCAIEQRQLGDWHALTNALALFLPIAWQLLLLRSEARERPEIPASEILLSDELQVLRAVAGDHCPPVPASTTPCSPS